jgi:hypothetical protein
MPSPFPGMDPYLESPHLWPDVHHGLISQIQSQLNPSLRPHYVARVELRVYISDEDDPGREVLIPDVRVEQGKPKGSKKTKGEGVLAIAEPEIVTLLLDEEIKEARVEIKHVATGALVTVIEVLSPSNKVKGSRGRDSFMSKRREILGTDANWVEIDLLRGGVPSVVRLRRSDYRILASRGGEERYRARYWRVGLRQPLPVIGIPLRAPDADVPLDLGLVLQAVYDRAAYDLSIDYHAEPDPRLSREDAAWADRLLRQQGLR